MSTYFYVVCHDHKEKCDAASRTAGGGVCHLCDSDHTLLPFLVAHCQCNIRVVSEHTEDDEELDYREWTAETVKEEIERER